MLALLKNNLLDVSVAPAIHFIVAGVRNEIAPLKKSAERKIGGKNKITNP
jgi:hypothetical protein